MKQNIIISCGAKKLEGSHKAIDLYTGSYFKANSEWALSITDVNHIFILSAKYGLIRANDVIETYEQKLNKITPEFIEKIVSQNESYKLTEAIVLGGITYRKATEHILERTKSIVDFLEKNSMGYQIQYLKNNIGNNPFILE